jgi:protein TonB
MQSAPALLVSLVDVSDVQTTPRAVSAQPGVLTATPPNNLTTRMTAPADAIPVDERHPSTSYPAPVAQSEQDPPGAESTEGDHAPDPSPSGEGEIDSPDEISYPPVAQIDKPAGAQSGIDYYRPLVLGIIEGAKRYPLFAQRHGWEGTVEISFLIKSDGTISNPEVVVPSPYQVIDDAALALVLRIGSLPPPPDRIPVQFPVRIEYTLESLASPIATEGAHP